MQGFLINKNLRKQPLNSFISVERIEDDLGNSLLFNCSPLSGTHLFLKSMRAEKVMGTMGL